MNNKSFDRLGIAVCRCCRHHHHHRHHWHLIPIEFSERVSNCALFSCSIPFPSAIQHSKTWEHEVVFVHEKRNINCGTNRKKKIEKKNETEEHNSSKKKCIFLYAFKYYYTDVVNVQSFWYVPFNRLPDFFPLFLFDFRSDCFVFYYYVQNKPYNYVYIGHTT